MRKRKAVETLGMPQGTASNRLRKMLLFRQLEKHNENVCVRCNQIILTVEELSVEHIKPWEGISAELFWDLDNVAFSHLNCNVAARRIFRGRRNDPKHGTWDEYTRFGCRCKDCVAAASVYRNAGRYRRGDRVQAVVA
jgi:hypothetical protein